jgi:hypothetical protein
VKYDISFLHTGEVHIAKFAALVAELNPELTLNHVVDESLLLHAQQCGADATLERNLTAHLDALSLVSKVVVVTCSSVGGIAEKIGVLNGCIIQRIDKAMADFAVQNSNNILVVAALESTLAPTHDLLLDSMTMLGLTPRLTFHHVKQAWDYFLAGEMGHYYEQIGAAIIANETKYDLVVLAQASMSEVENRIKVSIPVISSPRLGVERAIAASVIQIS